MSELREFGKFRLDTQKRQLWFEDKIVELPLKSIEVLCVLIETKGVVSKEDLLQRVWQGTFIEESTLSSYIYRLRKMFAEYGESEEIIQTIPKRGYRFNGKLATILISPSDDAEILPVKQIPSKPNKDQVRNIPEKLKQRKYFAAVLICLLILIASLGYFFYIAKAKKIDGVKTIAIGKFASLSDNEEEKVIALGIKEKILLNLGNLKELQVQNINFDENDFDKIKNAEAVLLGTVQKNNDQIRVNLRLLRTSDKKQLWASSFDEKQDGLFKLQDEISQRITNSLAVNLTKLDTERIYKRPTDNKDAYDQYLQGRYFFGQRGVLYSISLKKAGDFFEKAIELDPNFAEAYVGLANVINLLTDQSNNTNPKFDEDYQKSQQLISKALSINPNLGEAYAAQGWIQQRYEWNFADAEKSYLKAIELNPSLTDAYHWLSVTYRVQKKTELGLEYAKKAVEIEPTQASALENLATAYYYNGQCEKTLEIADRADAYLTDLSVRNVNRGLHLGYCGKCDEAIPLLEEVKVKNPTSSRMLNGLSYCYSSKNQTEKVNEIINSLDAKKESGQSVLARLFIYANQGEKEKAIQLLNKYYKTKDYRLSLINVHPALKPIQSEPRFKEIVRELNLEK